MTSDRDTVSGVDNTHTLNCTVSQVPFSLIDGTLEFSLSNATSFLGSKNITSSQQPREFLYSTDISKENTSGTIQYTCTVTLFVDGEIIDSKTNETTVEVVGKCLVFVLHMCCVCASYVLCLCSSECTRCR